MRSIVLSLVLLALLPACAFAAKARQAAPPLRADTPTCRTGVTPAERFAVFSASMPARSGAARMAMRFDLQLREPSDSRYRGQKAPSFGRWERSKTGRRGFIYSKRVDGLTAPATYRAIVRYRWYDGAGKVIASAHRTTPLCGQPDPRPNLRLLTARITSVSGGTATYLLTVVNSGRGPAGAFDVAVGPDDGGTATTMTVGGMAAREARVIEVTARPCSETSRLRVQLDVGAAVTESVELDNDVGRACPAVGAS
ncbi:MAG: hypothetical protein JHC95_10050 [Solirubrobacteraceae bacterium]|nr:hypothetical protein [Solirubrobacteraceae bacterium]